MLFKSYNLKKIFIPVLNYFKYLKKTKKKNIKIFQNSLNTILTFFNTIINVMKKFIDIFYIFRLTFVAFF